MDVSLLPVLEVLLPGDEADVHNPNLEVPTQPGIVRQAHILGF